MNVIGLALNAHGFRNELLAVIAILRQLLGNARFDIAPDLFVQIQLRRIRRQVNQFQLALLLRNIRFDQFGLRALAEIT